MVAQIKFKVERSTAQERRLQTPLKLRAACRVKRGMMFAVKKIIISKTATQNWSVIPFILNKLLNFNILLGSKRNNQTKAADQLDSAYSCFASLWCKVVMRKKSFPICRYPRNFIHAIRLRVGYRISLADYYCVG